MLKFFKQFCKQGTEMAVGMQVVQVAVQVQEKWRQSGWVSAWKQGQKTDRGPWVWGGLAQWDSGLKATVARRSLVFCYSGGGTAGLE